MATLAQCLNCFPIFDTLMAYLSATDSAILLGVTGLLYGTSHTFYDRYIHLLKDIPEYAGWIEKMLSKGHTLLVVGRDLEAIQDSYRYPETHWKRYSRKDLRSLWLVCLTTKMYKDSSRNTRTIAVTDEDGNVLSMPMLSRQYLRDAHWAGGDCRCMNALCDPAPLSLSYNMPGPNPWPQCTEDLMEGRSWSPLSVNKESNILLSYLRSYCTTDVLFHELTVGSSPLYEAIIGDSSSRGNSIRVPYLNLGTGQLMVSYTFSHQEIAAQLGSESEWTGEEWSMESNWDRFAVAFYQRQWGSLRDPTPLRYEFCVLEFAGLDPDQQAI